MSFTLAQQQAIRARGNVLIMAGAGTGKTRTLVERCLHCLLEENPAVSLEQILMVTFTEAAATEMRQRIRERIEQQSRQEPANLRWHEQLALFDRAHIGTLHSFCLQLVRAHFYELELDPQLAVLPEEESQLLAEETLNEVLDNHYSGRAPGAAAVQNLIQTHGLGSDKLIRGLVLRLHHYMQALADPAAWFGQQRQMFEMSAPQKWGDWLLEGFGAWRLEWIARLETRTEHEVLACLDALRSAVPTSREGIVGLLPKILAALGGCPGGKAQSKWSKQLQVGTEFFLSLATTDGETDPLREDWNWVRDQMIALLDLAHEFGQAFSQNKRELGMVDFHDLEQHALSLLWNRSTNQPTEIAAEWRRKLCFVFVDEYQDINAAQDRIIEALGGTDAHANRFLVGDIKQSIYRFRLANPRIFQSYAATWRDEVGRTIPLSDNFRSREGILNFINSLFARIIRPELGGVDYDSRAHLNFGAASERQPLSAAAEDGRCVELHIRLKQSASEFVPEEDNEEELKEMLELEDSDKEARVVALRFLELKTRQHPVWDETAKQFRPVQWRDMAALLRAPANKAESYAKEFSRLNIPLQVQRTGFYESVEVSDLISLLQILDNPLQDLPLLALLHSPLVGLRAAELAAIRLAAKGPFWTALVLWRKSEQASLTPTAPNSTNETLRKVSLFFDRFARWRRLARQARLSACLDAVLSETHYDDWLLTQPRGEEQHVNLQRLLALAQQFDKFQRQGLFRFLCLVEAQRRAETEPEVKAMTAENSVRLMSIHQSKGLEFPVVAVADLGKRFNLADLRAQIILDERFGLCPQIKPPHTGKRYPSLPYWLAQRRQFKELLGEEARLLYVATTRARDLLLLSLSVSQTTLERRWARDGESALESPFEATSCSDWVGLWFAEHLPERDPGRSSDETQLLRWFIHDETRLLDLEPFEPGESNVAPTVTTDVLHELHRRLSWEYPFPGATRTSAKASVTALRRRSRVLLDDTIEFQPADELRFQSRLSPGKTGGPGSALEIGQAHHSFLQLVSLDKTGSVAQLQSELRRLELNQALTADEIALIDLEPVAAFWNSPLGQRIRLHGPQVQRELPFTARFSPQELARITGLPSEPHLGENEFVIVQGVADLAVIMPEAIWLIDYKTDALEAGEVSGRADLYEAQMKLYARALAKIYSRPVTECWLYFLRVSQAVTIPSVEPDAMELETAK